ncbi:hypothetical protein BDV30DRAFT_115779 [Aspergillus minisclerotigenes]|uniref:Uncharacterized protein n=1 Tax=Aspergillus minisclerotigenes TaxID=656917 RepID=A0A5N6J2F7_9EURO|nr:hypothetical protein BDV30DRAFT_115779 [Aspergillus minisclerotigenes]
MQNVQTTARQANYKSYPSFHPIVKNAPINRISGVKENLETGMNRLGNHLEISRKPTNDWLYRNKRKKNRTEVVRQLHQCLATRRLSSLQHLVLGPFEALAYFLRLLPLLAHALHPYNCFDHGDAGLELLSWAAKHSAVTGLDSHLGDHSEIGFVTARERS